ncbi:hypothetical protein AKJ09_06969 [Labilithrix luteola]|uniref:IgGFc-binding protein N-terminal domain-containing protein n=1 Tax=Labilithrix luteola TaxID=1391654 RepID=A0A0K1Q386_9BACT|nr:IgGFc-binding protein [Labilithrix luteola]AKV00306.1 hypothetical protein AKJ09_06969 [Labilithrix luteola]
MRKPIFMLFIVATTGWLACTSDRSTWGDVGSDTFEVPDAGAGNDAAIEACAGTACSRDLRSVLDCTGNVIETCQENQACGEGKCIDPCSAAAVNAGSVGCSFAIPGSNGDMASRGSCFAFFVANNWTSPATLHLEFDGKDRPLDGAVWVPSIQDGKVIHTKLDGPLPAGGGAVIFFSHEEGTAAAVGSMAHTSCPDGVTPILDKDPVVHETGIGQAAFVSSDVPVSMYSLYPYGGAKTAFPSATLLFPTTSFGDKYILTSSWGGKSDLFGRGVLAGANPSLSQFGRPTLQVLAIDDDTSIDIRPKVDILGGPGVAASPKNTLVSYHLKRGDVLQITQENELVGSVMESNKKVGLFGGSTAMYIPSDVAFADQENEQIPPVSAWGREYAVALAPNRAMLMSNGSEKERDPSVIRLVGGADGVQLVYDPSRPDGAPTTLAAGERATFFADQPFVVRSQDSNHPFFVAAYMTGALASSYEIGDPEMVLVIPTDQWLDTYGFFSDSTYDSSSVVVTRRKDKGVFHDVILDCAGTLGNWNAITPDFEWTTVKLSSYGAAQTYPDGSCTDGPHRIHSDGPFTSTVWGISPAASYAYPGGAGLRPISKTTVTVH